MTTVEIIILVFFAIVVLTIFFSYFINSLKIKKKAKKDKEKKADAKVEQTKKDDEKKKTDSTAKTKTETVSKPKTVEKPKKEVVEVKVDSPNKTETNTVAIVTENSKPQTKPNSLENMSREEFEAQMNLGDDKKPEVKSTTKKSLKQQIDGLSPELKSVLFTDILKPKF